MPTYLRDGIRGHGKQGSLMTMRRGRGGDLRATRLCIRTDSEGPGARPAGEHAASWSRPVAARHARHRARHAVVEDLPKETDATPTVLHKEVAHSSGRSSQPRGAEMPPEYLCGGGWGSERTHPALAGANLFMCRPLAAAAAQAHAGARRWRAAHMSMPVALGRFDGPWRRSRTHPSKEASSPAKAATPCCAAGLAGTVLPVETRVRVISCPL